MAQTILVVDDDPVQRRLLETAITRSGMQVVTAPGGQPALDLIGGPRGDQITLVMLDLVMPDMGGLDVLAKLRPTNPDLPVIVLTAKGGIDSAVEAMRAGANDFLVKPASPERIAVSIRNQLKIGTLSGEVKQLKKKADNKLTFDDLVATSPEMKQVFRLGSRAAQSDIPVLIEGESGAGKELIARAIQGTSARSGKPFVTVNCGAIPENLIESILFGHEKGSFTGATDKHLGKFQEANGGTLFLDEVGELPLDMQVKLLRVLQEGEVDAIGSKRSLKVDVRIVSATNRDPAQAVKDGLFREDLFYRLNVFPIEAPALRERREDIPALVEHFIRRFNIEEGKSVTGASAETLAFLTAFDWPGNVRQLENAVYRAIVLADSPYLQPYDFPAISGVAAPPPEAVSPTALMATPPSLPTAQQLIAEMPTDAPVRILDGRGHLRTLEEIERDLIQLAIEIYAGHMSEVARRLGIGRSTLYRKVREQGLEGVLDKGEGDDDATAAA